MQLHGVVRPDRPLLVVALQEEAQALDDALPILGIHQVHTVMQHDFDSTAIRALVNRDYGTPLTLSHTADSARIVLATGDRFVADDEVRRTLSRDAHLVDMEGYAVTWSAQNAGGPVRLVKLVSDDAGEAPAGGGRKPSASTRGHSPRGCWNMSYSSGGPVADGAAEDLVPA